MNSGRRNFLKNGASLAAGFSVLGSGIELAGKWLEKKARWDTPCTMAKDAGMQLSEAYFYGMNEQKIALTKQMGVFGAVGGIDPKMTGLGDVQPWDYQALVGTKEACFMANVHCAAATQNFLALEHHSLDLPWWEDLVKTTDGRKLIAKGFVNLPLSAPGLGIELNNEVVKAHLHPSDKTYFRPTPEWNDRHSHDRVFS